MNDFAQELSTALIGFLLGLISNAITTFFSRQKKRLRYAVERVPVIAVTETVPAEIRELLPANMSTVTRFRITAENVGTLPIQDAGVLIEPDTEADLVRVRVSSIPPAGVLKNEGEYTKDGLKYEHITLDRRHRIAIDMFLKSQKTVNVGVHWFGGGGGLDVKGGTATTLGVQGHVEGIVFNYLALQVIEAVGRSAVLMAGLIAGDSMLEIFKETRTLVGLGVAQLLETLVRLYFYLRIARHLIALAAYAAERLAPLRARSI